MRNGFKANNYCDDKGNPSGGSAFGAGFAVSWQNGPLGRDGDRLEPNGAFVEDVIDVALQRLRFFQTASDGRFECRENAEAIHHLRCALQYLDKRTREREDRKVEGTHER